MPGHTEVIIVEIFQMHAKKDNHRVDAYFSLSGGGKEEGKGGKLDTLT